MCTQIIIKKVLLFFFTVYKNEQKELKFWQQKYQKSNFYNKNKKILNINNIDVNKILASKKEQYVKYNWFKYFIRYNDNDVIRLLYLFFWQSIGHINKFDRNKIIMSLVAKDKQLLENYIKIWKKTEELMKIDFNTETTYGDGDDKYVKQE